jgi:hypothetical protein
MEKITSKNQNPPSVPLEEKPSIFPAQPILTNEIPVEIKTNLNLNTFFQGLIKTFL